MMSESIWLGGAPPPGRGDRAEHLLLSESLPLDVGQVPLPVLPKASLRLELSRLPVLMIGPTRGVNDTRPILPVAPVAVHPSHP